MKYFMNVKIRTLISLCAMLTISFNGYCNVAFQTNTASQTIVTQTTVSNGVGMASVNFISHAGGDGHTVYCANSPGPFNYGYIRAFAIFDDTVIMRNKTTGQTYNVPVTCPSCQASIGVGFLFLGTPITYPQTKTCNVGMFGGALGATTAMSTTLYISLLDNRIPAGSYEGVVTGSVGEMGESYVGEDSNYTRAIIAAGLKSGVAGVTAMKFDMVIPNYTVCTTNSPLTIDHGSLTPNQVQGNMRSQSLIVACTGPATIDMTMSNSRPQVGSGIKSHIQVSSDNVNWAESSHTTLNNVGTKIIYFSSTLEAIGGITPQSLRGSAVVTMYYQ